MKRVYIGFDSREVDGYAVTRQSIEEHRRMRSPMKFSVHPIILNDLKRRGLYLRRTTRDISGRLYDVISQHHMATEFAISRFFVPFLMQHDNGRRDGEPNLAIFMDSDMLVKCDLNDLFDQADPAYAVQVVKHDYQPPNETKMDNQVQSQYARKNWSSVILWNVDHPAHRRLRDLLNEVPGRDLHRFCWLNDDEIGDLPANFNHLIGHDGEVPDYGILHFTEGLPSMGDQYNQGQAAVDWWETLHRWANN